jgi:hypothetical protein
MLTPDQYRARGAFLRFQHALDAMEQEMKPLRSELSLDCQVELGALGNVARNFFAMANREVFAAVKIEEWWSDEN